MEAAAAEEELLRCQIHEWYPRFKSHTIRTHFHSLPDSFVRYLLGRRPEASASASDSDADSPAPFLLPRPASGADPLPRLPAHLSDPVSSLSLIDSDSDDGSDGLEAPSFPELEAAVARSIADLGGAVLPKLNWSAPKDAAWISADGSLRCTSFAEVALLLRASDAAAHDLSLALPSSSSPVPFHLALRRWYPALRPEMEFRCFARCRRLTAVSQRDPTAFYPALLDHRSDLLPLISRFFDEVVRSGFESEDYTFDVYVTSDGRVKVLDFNPWGAFTLPLLFTWEELEEEGFGEGGVEFRIVENQCGVRPGLKTAVPYDYLDTSEGSGWDEFLKRADEELRKQNKREEQDGSES